LTSRVLWIMNSYVGGKQGITGILSKCWNV
jgi:hypothetical protein